MTRHKPTRRNLRTQPGFVADSKTLFTELILAGHIPAVRVSAYAAMYSERMQVYRMNKLKESA